MRVREISYSKKIGLPIYGSLGLTVTAGLEANDAFDDAYHGLRAMVDDQIESSIPTNGHSNGNGRATTQTQPTVPPPDLPPNLWTRGKGYISYNVRTSWTVLDKKLRSGLGKIGNDFTLLKSPLRRLHAAPNKARIQTCFQAGSGRP